MKKIILTMVLLATVSGAFSQTKEETEKWIIEKIKKYHGSSAGYKIEDVSFTSNGYLNIKITERHDLSTGYYQYIIAKWHLPVWAIGDVSISRSEVAVSSMNSRYTSFLYFGIDRYTQRDFCKFSVSVARVAQNNSYNLDEILEKYLEPLYPVEYPDGYGNLGRMYFNSDPEEDFVNRFNKAIQHLKTFYPKPVKKETF